LGGNCQTEKRPAKNDKLLIMPDEGKEKKKKVGRSRTENSPEGGGRQGLAVKEKSIVVMRKLDPMGA